MKTCRLLGPICWLLLFGVHFASLAAPVGRDAALRAAARWHALSPQPMRKPAGNIAKITTYANAAGLALFHVVDLEPAGYVVISADDRLEPVIAFSQQGKFVAQPGHPLFDLLRKDTEARISAFQPGAKPLPPRAGSKESAKWQMLTAPAAAPDDSSTTSSLDDECVAPLTHSQWNQSTIWAGVSQVAVFNYYTPPNAAGSINNYVCGCTATAWAQIMRYYQWPVTGVGTQSLPIYVDGTPESQALRGGDGAGGPYDWADMALVPGSGITPQQCQAIGALTADAGVANNMAYAADGSAAYLSSTAIMNIFHYANAAYSEADLSEMLVAIRTNLDAGMPVALSIWNSTEGHQVVCDGYGYNQSTLYHHINMGWGGEDDLWYNLPTIYIFNSIEGCTYNVNPTASGEVISGRITNSNGTPVSGVTVSVSGPATYTGTTNQEGIFAFKGLASNKTWTVVPAASGYSFGPAQQVVSTGHSTDFSSIGDATVDFTADGGSLQVAINPAAAVSAGAEWNLDGGLWQQSGATVGVSSPGSHTVNFTPVNGWTAPTSQTVVVSATQTTEATATYVPIPQFGSLLVAISPAAAVSNGAEWNVDGGGWQTSGSVVSGLSPGSHTVKFSTAVVGYTAPPSQSVSVTANQTAVTSATYSEIVSSITVDYPPGTPIVSGSSIIDCGVSLSSTATSLTFEVLNNSATNLVLSGWSVIGADASDFNTNLRTPATILPGGSASFQLTFHPQAPGDRTATLELASNDLVNPSFDISLSGTGISFSEQAGAYEGWIDNGLLSLNVTKTGAFTGKLLLNGETISMNGKFGANGTFSGNFGNPSLPVSLTLGLASIAVSVGEDSLTAYRAQSALHKPVPEAGRYTLLLTGTQPSATAPAGAGYGTLTVSAVGTVTLAGKLADGTAFSTRSLVVEAGTCGAFAVLVPKLYKGQGYLSGSALFSGSGSTSCDGSLEWCKPKQSGTSGYYPGGFDTTLNLSAAQYVAPARQTAALPFSQGLVQLSGGSLGAPITDAVDLSPSNIITVSDANPNGLKLTIAAATGSLSGSFVHPLTNKIIKFGGVLLKDSANPCAAGFFLGPIVSGTGSAGAITLTPSP